MDVVVLDYGAGNVSSVLKAFAALGACARVGPNAAAFLNASAIVVPGVGHFERTGAVSPQCRATVRGAVSRGTPLLGICLGLQWLFEGSDEAPGVRGLGLLGGSCFRLQGRGLKVPHVGWNSIEPATPASRLLSDLPADSFAYFTHSFAAPVVPETTGTTTHGETFSSVVEYGNIFGVQFHPEKSGATGLAVLANFLATGRG